MVALTTWSAAAQTTYRVEDVPNVQLIDYTRFVSDPNDSIDGDKYGSAREFANELFNIWGIGNRETNRGLLILLITN